MAGLLTRFLYKVGLKKRPVKFEKLRNNKNLVVGTNCNLNDLEIHIHNAQPGFTNITIGNDCILAGKIILHNNKAKVLIGNRVFTGHSTELICNEEIQIGDDVMLSWGITLLDTNAHSLKSEERKNDVKDWKKGATHKNWSNVNSKKLIIENKCWIGFNSIILKGLTLGTGSVIAAGSVVTKDVAPFTVVGGNPATYIKQTT